MASRHPKQIVQIVPTARCSPLKSGMDTSRSRSPLTCSCGHLTLVSLSVTYLRCGISPAINQHRMFSSALDYSTNHRMMKRHTSLRCDVHLEHRVSSLWVRTLRYVVSSMTKSILLIVLLALPIWMLLDACT